MQNIKRSLNCLSIIKRQTTWSCRTIASTSSENGEIIIPNRIHRSPTDILKALSQTVGMDPTAPHYKYHDDPFLIPMSNVGKRTFAMAQESGRKSAKWIRQENAHLFQVRSLRIVNHFTTLNISKLLAQRNGSSDRSFHSNKSLH